MEKSNKIRLKNIDEYLAAVPEPARTNLEKLRKIIKDIAPQAEEVISYGMPAFDYYGILVYFAAFKDHCSFFPGGIVDSFKDELKAYKTSKGTIQFPLDKPLPASLVKKIVKVRMKQNEERKKRKS
ncbi:MAG: DUF1801 domain-containing protein [Bacteroidetes bacterium]|nr:MAG: DUF1801 domain-containing protein [Bacteroidota bacterium]